MKLKHIRQPPESKMCGQCCVAMLCGIALQDAVFAIGHKHGTRTSEVRKAIEKYGLKVNGRKGGLKRIGKTVSLPRTSLVKMLPLKGVQSHRSHWIVIHEGRVYDPGCDPDEISDGRLSSFLEIVGVE